MRFLYLPGKIHSKYSIHHIDNGAGVPLCGAKPKDNKQYQTHDIFPPYNSENRYCKKCWEEYHLILTRAVTVNE
jgi:hypothetical protein